MAKAKKKPTVKQAVHSLKSFRANAQPKIQPVVACYRVESELRRHAKLEAVINLCTPANLLSNPVVGIYLGQGDIRNPAEGLLLLAQCCTGHPAYNGPRADDDPGGPGLPWVGLGWMETHIGALSDADLQTAIRGIGTLADELIKKLPAPPKSRKYAEVKHAEWAKLHAKGMSYQQIANLWNNRNDDEVTRDAVAKALSPKRYRRKV